jgi:NAD(P) transhydrogenase subunit alpha
MINPVVLILVFIVCTVLGYVIIRNVPSLLHTPLMSGMNALSGVTIVGAISATGIALLAGDGGWLSQVVGMLAIVLAAVNVFGGFGVTHRMLMMFNKKKKK